MITVIGSLNMDLVASVPRFPVVGETLAASGFTTCCGGKGANQAVAAARLGSLLVSMLGAVGTDASGDQLLNVLSRAGVDCLPIYRRENVPTGNAMILVGPDGRNLIVVNSGANGTLSPSDVRTRFQHLGASRAVIAQLETPLETVRAAFECGRASSGLTVLNPAPARPLDDSLLGLCDWLIVNEHEAETISGVPVNSPETAGVAASAIRRRSPATRVAVTLGPAGVWIEGGEERFHQPGFPVEAVDTVGAGDTFVGGFTAELVATQGDLRRAARFACAAAALSVTRRGAIASIPSRAEVEEFLRRVGSMWP